MVFGILLLVLKLSQTKQ